MKQRIALALGFGCSLALLAAACNGGGGTTDTGVNVGARPFQASWEEVIRTPFPLDVVAELTVGGTITAENFANRGDIDVRFDLDTPEIVVEMRKYAFQADQEEADATFAKMSIWAYKATASQVKKPGDMDPEDDCTNTWQDGCRIRVYYDGQSQPVRTGADLRVHLPRAYRRSLNIITEDNLSEDGYKLRGDVTIVDLCGNANATLSEGVAKIRMCSELQEGPTCPPEAIADCEEKNWDPGCACSDFGSLRVTSREPYGANITVDFPLTVWTTVDLENTTAGATCTANFANCGDRCTLEQSSETPQKGRAEYNYPGEPAIPGVGYSMQIEANGCGGVFYVEGPDDYEEGAEESPKSEQRGNLEVCTGCLADL